MKLINFIIHKQLYVIMHKVDVICPNRNVATSKWHNYTRDNFIICNYESVSTFRICAPKLKLPSNRSRGKDSEESDNTLCDRDAVTIHCDINFARTKNDRRGLSRNFFLVLYFDFRIAGSRPAKCTTNRRTQLSSSNILEQTRATANKAFRFQR